MRSTTTRTTAATLVAIAVVTGIACWAIGGAHAPDDTAAPPHSARAMIER